MWRICWSAQIGRSRCAFFTGILRDSMSLQSVVERSASPITSFTWRRKAIRPPASPRRSTPTTPISRAPRACSRRCAGRTDLNPVIHVCASSEVYGRVPKEKVPINEECTFHPASPYAISKVGTDLVGRFHAEAYGQKVMTTRMFTHTGPRRGDVFAESTFAKQIAMIEQGRIPPVVKVGNLDSLRTWSDVRDAVRAYHLLLDGESAAGRVLQHRRRPLLYRRRHAEAPAVAFDAQGHQGGNRSGRGCARSTRTCRCPTHASSGRTPAGSRKFRSSRRCATCSTTGARA